jgi:hypothetical protein
MSKGHSGLIKKFPHTPGIDASGTIYYSNSKKFKKNEKVFVIAHPLGVDTMVLFQNILQYQIIGLKNYLKADNKRNYDVWYLRFYCCKSIK